MRVQTTKFAAVRLAFVASVALAISCGHPQQRQPQRDHPTSGPTGAQVPPPAGPVVRAPAEGDFFSDPTHAQVQAFAHGLRELTAHQRPLDGPSLDALLRGIRSNPNAPALISQIVVLAFNAHSEPDKALAIYQSLLTLPIPTEPGPARQDWLRALNNALVLSFNLKDFPLSARMADGAQPYAAENPYIFHSAACSYVAVGDLDKAMNQVKLAVKYHYPHLDKLRVDTDLGPLLDRPDFIALFPKVPAAR